MLAQSSRGLPLPLNAIFDTPTFRNREATWVLLTQLGSNTAVNFEASKRLRSSEFSHPALCALHRMARHLSAYMSPQAVRHMSLALQPYSSSDLVPQGFIGRSVLLSWRTKPTDVSSAPACEPISLRTSKLSHLFMCPRPALCLPSTLVCRSCFSITRMLFLPGPPSIHSFVAVMNCVNGHPMPLFSKDTLPPQSRISPPLLSAPWRKISSMDPWQTPFFRSLCNCLNSSIKHGSAGAVPTTYPVHLRASGRCLTISRTNTTKQHKAGTGLKPFEAYVQRRKLPFGTAKIIVPGRQSVTALAYAIKLCPAPSKTQLSSKNPAPPSNISYVRCKNLQRLPLAADTPGLFGTKLAPLLLTFFLRGRRMLPRDDPSSRLLRRFCVLCLRPQHGFCIFPTILCQRRRLCTDHRSARLP